MVLLEKLFYLLFPKTLLKGTPWEGLWEQQEKSEFLAISRVFFAITFIGYISHYYTVDRFEGLAPSDLWFNYRYGMATVSLICLLIYSTPMMYKNLNFYRIPLIIASALFCYFQTRSMVWYPKVPYSYSFGFVITCCVVLRSTILQTIIAATFYFLLIIPTMLDLGHSPAMLGSAFFFTLSVIVFSRTKYLSDINFFLLSKKNIEQQKKIIELNIEFSDQIKAFLPAEISSRIDNSIKNNRLSVMQAVDEVLRAKKVKVACLFSDIRGFTKSSNDLDGFVSKAVFPNLKASTQAIEKYKGIPRKIGDLIFAYFDFDENYKSTIAALNSAIEISKVTYSINTSNHRSQIINRYILLSFGEAIVGNLSSFNSAIEVTAIGSPVNLLSRVDELTKNIKIAPFLEGGDILITKSFYEMCADLHSINELQILDLSKLNLEIRDFPEESILYVLKQKNLNRIFINNLDRKSA